MHLRERFLASLQQNRLIEPEQTVLIAVSGGLDSVVLLHLLRALRCDLDLQLHVAHLDHRMRDGSALDAAWVTRLCDEWQIACTVSVAPEIPANEEQGRVMRYDFLESTAD